MTPMTTTTTTTTTTTKMALLDYAMTNAKLSLLLHTYIQNPGAL